MAVKNSTDSCGTSPSSPATVDDLCRSHVVLVQHEVRALMLRLPQHADRDDLVSAGMAALLQAARSFDPSLGVPFGAYAVRRIRGALIDELRTIDWASRSVRSRVREREASYDALVARLGRTPTAEELAAEMGVDVTELHQLDADLHRSVVLSIDSLPSDPHGSELLPAAAETPDSVLERREKHAYLQDAVQALPERLRRVVVGYFIDERPMKALAEELGVTESRISQLRAEALIVLRDGLNAHLQPDLMPAGAAAPTGVVARRREAYYAAIASRSTFQARLTARASYDGSIQHTA